MAYVQLATISTGVGNLTITVISGTVPVSAVANSFSYHISSRLPTADWEIGTGHCPNATTLVRDVVTDSSNNALLVNFQSGTKDITSGIPIGDTSDSSDVKYVNVTGDTMTGFLITRPIYISKCQYVTNHNGFFVCR